MRVKKGVPHTRGQEVPALQKLRRQAGLTQQELAQKADLGVVTIRRLEKGARGDVETLDKLAAALSQELKTALTRQSLMKSPSQPARKKETGLH
jgi:transcriptional regulator with XRE-family HTH domain